MKTVQHTPEPWCVNGQYIEDQYGTIAKVMRPEDNSTLIAAAPELLESLELLINMDVNGHSLIDRLQFSTKGREISNKIRAAIAKAKRK